MWSQYRDVALAVLLAHPEDQRLVHGRTDRDLVEVAAEHAEDRHGSALAAGEDRLAQRDAALGVQSQRLLGAVVGVLQAGAVRLDPDGLDARVRSATTSGLPQRVEDVDVLVVERLRTGVALGHRQPLGQPVDRDHPLRTEQVRGARRGLADGAKAPRRDDAARPQVAHVRAHPPPVGSASEAKTACSSDNPSGTGNALWPAIGTRISWGMATGESASGVGVAVNAADRVPPALLLRLRLRGWCCRTVTTARPGSSGRRRTR
jgi:hypothetical protein